MIEEKMYAFHPLKFWSYWTEVYQMFTMYQIIEYEPLKSELRYLTPFRNAKTTNEGGPANFVQFKPRNRSPWQLPLSDLKRSAESVIYDQIISTITKVLVCYCYVSFLLATS